MKNTKHIKIEEISFNILEKPYTKEELCSKIKNGNLKELTEYVFVEELRLHLDSREKFDDLIGSKLVVLDKIGEYITYDIVGSFVLDNCRYLVLLVYLEVEDWKENFMPTADVSDEVKSLQNIQHADDFEMKLLRKIFLNGIIVSVFLLILVIAINTYQ